MCIQELGAGELDEALNVINESNRTWFRAIIPALYFKDPVLTLDELVGMTRGMTFYTYKANDRIVGTAALVESGDRTGQMRWVYILPGYQRGGVGTALVRHVEAVAAERGLGRLMVVTSKGASWARAFYLKLGYALVEVRETREGGEAVYCKHLG